jgi:hypothetical protein
MAEHTTVIIASNRSLVAAGLRAAQWPPSRLRC